MRIYIPSLARFSSRDPISERGGLNLYAYVSNNPTNRWDYLGMYDGIGNFPDRRPLMDEFYNPRLPSPSPFVISVNPAFGVGVSEVLGLKTVLTLQDEVFITGGPGIEMYEVHTVTVALVVSLPMLELNILSFDVKLALSEGTWNPQDLTFANLSGMNSLEVKTPKVTLGIAEVTIASAKLDANGLNTSLLSPSLNPTESVTVNSSGVNVSPSIGRMSADINVSASRLSGAQFSPAPTFYAPASTYGGTLSGGWYSDTPVAMAPFVVNAKAPAGVKAKPASRLGGSSGQKGGKSGSRNGGSHSSGFGATATVITDPAAIADLLSSMGDGADEALQEEMRRILEENAW